MGIREFIPIAPFHETNTTGNVTEVNFAEKATRTDRLHRLRLGRQSLRANVFCLPEDYHAPEQISAADSNFIIDTLAGNIITMLESQGCEGEAEQLLDNCTMRAKCGDSLSDINKIAMTYIKNVDEGIFQFFERRQLAMTGDSQS